MLFTERSLAWDGVSGSLNLSSRGVTDWTSLRRARTTLPGKVMSWFVLLVTVTDKIVASPSFTVVRDSWTVNPECQVANPSGSKMTGVLR